MYDNYLFDLYGTLIDIRTDEHSKNFFKKYAKWLRRHGFSFTWKKFRRLYLSFEKQYRENALKAGIYRNPEIDIRDVFRDILTVSGYPGVDETCINRLCKSFRNISRIRMRLFPDTLFCLNTLRKADKKIYLLSNAQRSFTWQELEQTGLLSCFDGILISSDEGCMKPDPAFYDLCCERYHLDKSRCIMIGNEQNSDMKGARDAGIDGFYINRSPVFHGEKEPVYKYVSKSGSLEEVLIQTLAADAKMV